MRHLLAKDVRLVAPYLWLIVPAHVLFCVQAFLVPELDFWMNLAVALAWTAAIALVEWQSDTDRLIASLPTARATVVEARYASALAAVAIGLLLYIVYGHAVMAVATDRLMVRWSGMTPAWTSADGVAAFLLVGYLLVVVFLPFYFRFGFSLGAMLFSVSAAAAIAVATALTRLGVRGKFAAGPAHAGLAPSETVREWLSSLSVSWGPAAASLAILAAATLFGVLSVRLSIRFYQRRDL
jgi:hypothetical protein